MKTVEEIALEVLESIGIEDFGLEFSKEESPDPDDVAFINRFATRLLVRVDQERGKDAVAWRIKTGYEQPKYMYSSKVPDRGRSEPLFLSPTIPEGMALVPIEPTQEMCEQAYYEFNAEQKDFDAANLYRAMIQAAQEGVTK